MGWASGTRLMDSLIDAFTEHITDAPEEQTIAFWGKVIEILEEDDWDCQFECVGRNPTWDKAFFKHDPYAAGYFTDELNPYAEETTQYDKWVEGREDR